MVCKYLETCVVHEYIELGAIDKVYEREYCFGEFTVCKRFQIRETGTQPPEELLPDGKSIKEVLQ